MDNTQQAFENQNHNQRALSNARGHLFVIECLHQSYKALVSGESVEEEFNAVIYTDPEQIADELRERPQEVGVKSSWHSLGISIDNDDDSEFKIVLSLGFPACRVWGEFKEDHEPDYYNTKLQYGNFNYGWTDVEITPDEQLTLIWFAGLFFQDY